MEKYVLDKVIPVDTLLRAETDKAFAISEVGTNSTTKATLSIANVPCLDLVNIIAPLRSINTNLNPLLCLGDQFLVVPPGKPFRVSGSSGSSMRLRGYMLIFAPGEVLPSPEAARFAVQGKEFKSYIEGTYSSAAAASIGEYEEFDVLTFTCPVGEEWVFKELYMGEVWTTADTIAREKLVTRIYIDDYPLDVVEREMAGLGLYGSAAPHPAREDINVTPFSLEQYPITLTSGRTLKVTCINIGAAATLAAGETLEARVKLVGIKKLLV